MTDGRPDEWPTMSQGDVIDGLERYGVSREQAARMTKWGRVHRLRELEVLNEAMTNCEIASLVAELKKRGVTLARKPDGDYRLVVPDDTAANLWVKSILPSLRVRKTEIVAAWDGPAAETRQCMECLATIYLADYDGVGCPQIFSCPFRGQES